jgi:hypothetical protein
MRNLTIVGVRFKNNNLYLVCAEKATNKAGTIFIDETRMNEDMYNKLKELSSKRLMFGNLPIKSASNKLDIAFTANATETAFGLDIDDSTLVGPQDLIEQIIAGLS